MKNNITKILSALSLVGIVWIIFNLKKCNSEPKKQYWQDPNFKTDTFKVNVPFEVKGGSFPFYVPPKIVV